MTAQLDHFLEHVRQGKPIDDPDLYAVMIEIGQKNRELTARLNSQPLSEDEVRQVIGEITGNTLDEGFRLFPPFTTDFGRNTHIGKDVFINSGARFQDQGGIYIGDGCQIGHNAVITTLNHDFAPEKRHIAVPSPVRLGAGVWLGANVTLLPGVTIGDYAVIAAGAVVSKDVPARTLVAGVPAREIRKI